MLKEAEVRENCTTALAKLLLDADFEIVQPSLTMGSRFKLSYNPAPSDLQIKDRYDQEGVEPFRFFDGRPGEHFEVRSGTLQRYLETALEKERKIHPISDNKLTSFCALITAFEENKSM